MITTENPEIKENHIPAANQMTMPTIDEIIPIVPHVFACLSFIAHLAVIVY